MRPTIPVFVAAILLGSCRSQLRSGDATVFEDSVQLVARAFAAIDSVRGTRDTLQLTVRQFRRDPGLVEVILGPVSAAVRGGGSHVRFDSAGRVVFVRLFQ